jgi:arabinogalactan oligomer/maltooligosaccharide transport system substrate-binding protein
MMGTLSTAMALPSRFIPATSQGWLRTLVLIGSLLLSGCTGGGLPAVVYLAGGTNSDQTIDAELLAEYNARLRLLEKGFRQINRNTQFQFSLYSEDRIEATIRVRATSGLGPDLLFVNGDTALRLMRKKLVAPYPATAAQLNLFDPEELKRLRAPNGQLAGLPVLMQAQLACFNRKVLPKAPSTLNELLANSAQGKPSALSVDLYNLFWTAGSLGAIPAINKALLRQPIGPQDRSDIQRWLAWLQNASNQQGITFYGTQQAIEAEFLSGRVAWIPCRSTSLPRLRRRLGQALGVSALPEGRYGQASPVNRLRVLALGTSSSAMGRQRALAFSRYAVNPLVQREFSMGSQTVLPANRFVKVPTSSSTMLAAMVQAGQQGSQINEMVAMLHSNDPRIHTNEHLITQLVFGEITPRNATNRMIAVLQSTPAPQQ